ncbi:RSVR protein, partial [Furnarius figulus]|nr:RSVR protein [Furnarius figulus]
PDEFQCTPGDLCYPRGWLCDGHADCEDAGDERGCGTAPPSPAGPPGGAGTGPDRSLCPRCLRPLGTAAGHGGDWVSACALSSPGLLSILVAASSIAVWGLFKAKHRSNTISLEKASREQLMPDKSQ